VTLFMDSVLRAVPGPDAPRRLFLPVGVPADERAKLRQDGWQTVAALADVGDVPAEARRLECSHVYDAGKITLL
jgi:ATP phosphoribosyltransferase regulatory subunit